MRGRVFVFILCLTGFGLGIGSAGGDLPNAGQILGVVTDNSRAVIPNATITATNEDTGAVFAATSGADGAFAFAALPSGSYSVVCRQPGFKRFVATNVRVVADRLAAVAITLTVGDRRDVVEVTTERSGVFHNRAGGGDMENFNVAERSGLITLEDVRNLPVAGRNASALIKILPGMAIAAGTIENRDGYNGATVGINGPVGSYSTNGTQPSAIDLLADGAHVIDPGCNCNALMNLNSDMVQELRVETSNFPAENAKGPIVLNAVGRAGSRDFHAEGYLYARHFALNSAGWMASKDGIPKPEDRYFYPGGNIGGPVRIPWSGFNRGRDKLFFFAAFEYYRQILADTTLRAFVPTPAMLEGDFSQASLDRLGPGAGPGWNRQPAGFPSGRIPQTLMDPGGLALAHLLPAPNADPLLHGGSDYIDNVSQEQNGWQTRARLDDHLSERTHLAIAYGVQKELVEVPINLWWIPIEAVRYPSPVAASNRADSVSLHLTQTFRPTRLHEFTATYSRLDVPYRMTDNSHADRFQVGYPYRGMFANGTHQIPSFTSNGDGVPSMMMPGGFETGSMRSTKRMPTLSDTVTLLASRHILRAGAYWESTGNEQVSSNNNQGLITFSRSYPGSTGNTIADLLLGRAADYQEANKSPVYHMQYHELAFFAQDSWRVTQALAVEFGARFSHLTPWENPGGPGFAVWDPAAYPLAGGATPGVEWHAIDRRIPNSGAASRGLLVSPRVGLAYDVAGGGATVLRGGWGIYRYHDSFNPVAGALDIPLGVRTYEASGGVLLSAIDQIRANPAPTGFEALDGSDRGQPLTYTYSVSLQQRMPGGSVLDVAYVGNRSANLLTEGALRYVNMVPAGALFPLADASTANIDSLRPYPAYQQIVVPRHEAYQNYNGLQATWARQRGRLSYNVNYTFSKALGIRGAGQGSVSDPFTLHNNYGPLSYDRTHIFNAIVRWDAGKWLKRGGLLGAALNDWQISTITQWQSGVNLQAIWSSNFNLAGTLPDGRPLSNWTILGTPDLPLQPRLVCDPRSNLRANQYVNGDCFAPPAAGTNGDFIFPYVKGPAFFNSDLAAFKSFRCGEHRHVQLRFAAFNFLNHPLPSFLGSGESNLTLQFDPSGRLTRPDFGVVTNKTGRRLVQLAIKLQL
ncbi:MAG: carboxypeptidase-like regulatory domain-containing protein [Acidobacteriia bacterium]|nr:carboxypeptidase-like regulatory domain-containing protein [Terriglobia bacterium]